MMVREEAATSLKERNDSGSTYKAGKEPENEDRMSSEFDKPNLERALAKNERA